MPLFDLFKKKTPEDQALEEQAKARAQQEVRLILAQREKERQDQLQKQAYEKELYKQTTTKGQRFQEGLKKVGGKLQGVAQKTGEIGKEFKMQSSMGSKLRSAPIDSKFKNSINLDNTLNSKMGNQIFGNTFNQSQDSLKKKIGGFSKKL